MAQFYELGTRRARLPLLVLAGVLSAAGCLADEGADPNPSATAGAAGAAVGSPADPDSEPIYLRGGTPAPHRGIVQLSSDVGICTGFFLNERIVVTAAHCVPAGPAGSTARFEIEGYRSSSKPNVLFSGFARFARDPDYSGNSANDVAVVYRDRDVWSGTNYQDYLRIYQDHGRRLARVRVWGAGYGTYSENGGGTLRYADFDVVGWPSEPSYGVFKTRGGDVFNMCEGDSGGPDIELAGIELVAGVNSKLATAGDNACAEDGGYQYHARINWDVLSWIIAETESSCELMNANGYDYRRCFAIPFVNDIPEEGLDRSLATAIAVSVL